MRICLVYDCLFPHTVGGAERWYRNLAERLAAEGHEVTYLTLRQWDGHEHGVAGVDVRAVGPRMELYVKGVSGRRRILPPLVFGAGVLLHLLRHGRRYDVVHTASFPYFSLLRGGPGPAARALPPGGGLARGVVAGVLARVPRARPGPPGHRSSACAHACPSAPSASPACTPRGCVEEGLRGEPGRAARASTSGALEPAGARRPRRPLVVFAGRHIPEKRVPALVDAMPALRAPGAVAAAARSSAMARSGPRWSAGWPSSASAMR